MPIQNNLSIRSEEVQDILTAIPNWMILWGNTLIFFLILGVMGLSFWIKYPDIIPSEAMISTLQPPHHEYAQIAGKLDTLFVENNQQVEQGSPLAIIENPAHFADVFLLKEKVMQIEVGKHDFAFPVDQLPLLILGDIEAAFAVFENNYNQYTFNKRWQPLANAALANQNTLGELNRQLINLEQQQQLYVSELNIKKKELFRQQQLLEQGLLSEQDFQQQQLEQVQTERNFKNSQLSISQTREAIGKVEQSLQDTELNRTKEEKILLRKAIQSFNMLKKAIRDWELQYVLRAEIAGKVSFLDYWTQNQRLQQG
ncbi:MAG: biotin/lipoyl-binding protein, partial [Bacteroidota bacterium]